MAQPVDSSGNRNHALGQTVAGSPWGTAGASAVFRQHFILIPHSTSFETTDYSVSFWIYRLQDEKAKTDSVATPPLQRWCPSKLRIEETSISVFGGSCSQRDSREKYTRGISSCPH